AQAMAGRRSRSCVLPATRLTRYARQSSNRVNRDVARFVNRGESDIRHGNADRWPGHEDLVRTHYGRLRRLCEFLLGDKQEAEEVVQDTFMKAYEANLGSGTPNDWAAWLTQVAVNACRDRRRAGWWMRFRRWSDPIEDVPLPAVGPSPADAATAEEMRRRIWAAFRTLPERQ